MDPWKVLGLITRWLAQVALRIYSAIHQIEGVSRLIHLSNLTPTVSEVKKKIGPDCQ